MIVNVNEEYRFTVEERQYSLQRKYTVDPTRAPNYKPDTKKPTPAIREEWRNIDINYSANDSGLVSLLHYVARRVVAEQNTGPAVDLSTYIRMLSDELAKLRKSVEAAMTCLE